MKTAIVLFVIGWAVPLMAAPLVVVKGGVSPDKRFAVAVVPQKEGDSVESVDNTVYLVDHQTKKPIGPLEEVDSSGGTWGNTVENVRARWSPDGRFLAINVRTGRLIGDFVLYEITRRRAKPQTLPEDKSHPRGKIFDYLEPTANSGKTMMAWLSPTRFTAREYMFILKPEHRAAATKLGFPDFEAGSIEMLYSFEKGRWVLKDVRLPTY